jgi:hypothetical protein
MAASARKTRTSSWARRISRPGRGFQFLPSPSRCRSKATNNKITMGLPSAIRQDLILHLFFKTRTSPMSVTRPDVRGSTTAGSLVCRAAHGRSWRCRRPDDERGRPTPVTRGSRSRGASGGFTCSTSGTVSECRFGDIPRVHGRLGHLHALECIGVASSGASEIIVSGELGSNQGAFTAVASGGYYFHNSGSFVFSG